MKFLYVHKKNETEFTYCMHVDIFHYFTIQAYFMKDKSHICYYSSTALSFHSHFWSSFQHRIIWHRLIESSKTVKAPSCKKRSIIILQDLREKTNGERIKCVKILCEIEFDFARMYSNFLKQIDDLVLDFPKVDKNSVCKSFSLYSIATHKPH